jgi:hypothetical protein
VDVVQPVTVVAYGRFEQVPAATFDRVITTTITGATADSPAATGTSPDASRPT